MRRLELTQGYTAIVDDEDYARCMQHCKWHADVQRKDGVVLIVYARSSSRRDKQRLHRFILGVTDPKVLVDHRDGDGLNCQRHNLRVATKQQNQQHQRMPVSNTSGYKGVTQEAGKWRARIVVGYVHLHLGYFSTAKQAADAYDVAALKYHGAFAVTNTKAN